MDRDLLSLLEEHERRHRRDLVPSRGVARLVDVDLGERQVARHAVGFGQLCEDGADLLAGPAPRRREVDRYVRGVGKEGLELREGGGMVQGACHCAWCGDL